MFGGETVFRIVHLSDFHFDQTQIEDYENFTLKAIQADLQKFNSEKQIDFIVFTGDLVDKGGKSFGDLEYSFLEFEERVITPILSCVGLTKNDFFFVPGNHDIDRNADKVKDEIGMEGWLNSPEIVNQYIDSNDTDGRKRMLPFKNYERSFFNNYNGIYDISDFQSSFIVTKNNTDIGIACFNTSWRCYESEKDKGKIILGERQLTRANKNIQNCEVKIALLHHSFDWLAPFESKTISNMVIKNYDLMFCGHVHEGSSFATSNMYGNIFISVAPSNWSLNMRSNDRSFSNGYSVIDYDPEIKKVTLHARRYSHQKQEFDPNPDLGDEIGIVTHYFPDNKELSKREARNRIVSTIALNNIDEINTHLLTYNTETKAPKEIDLLFVMPQIVGINQYNELKNKSEKVAFSLDEICSSNHNLLILGSKESGKTILLDKILLEYTKNLSKYNTIPVLINFEDFKTNRMETTISRFLGISVLQVSQFLVENKVKILIDNLSFNKNNEGMLRKIESFLDAYPAVTVISTCTSSANGEAPLDIYEYPAFSLFKHLHLKPFKTREIRDLSKKWFRDYNEYDSPEKINNIINIFKTLNIPSTPLAISMFLWILEQQENYKPVNNATMLENFIQRLFKKTSKTEIYSEKFDFTNKERLLSEISLKMYKNNEENYRIKYTELRAFITNYLKIRKFDFRDEEVLHHFIDKGILVIEKHNSEEYLRFRFACFFQYFLMKNMMFDDSFKAYVLSEENYLSFVDEINYYTGLKRDESLILELVVSRMNEEFKDLTNKINELEQGIDTVFETQKSIASSLDDSFVKNITGTKKTEDQFDELQDKMLESISQETEISKKEDNISRFEKLERSWTLAAYVLKNTEETKIENLKSDSFNYVLSCAISHSILHKVLLIDYLSKSKKSGNEINEQLVKLEKFLPLVYQLLFFNTRRIR